MWFICLIFLFLTLILQIGAIGIWSYVYAIMRISANKCKKEINLDDSTISIRTSGETLEILSEGCTEALLPSKDCPSSRECSEEVELTHAGSEGKQKVFPSFNLNINIAFCIFWNFFYKVCFQSHFEDYYFDI